MNTDSKTNKKLDYFIVARLLMYPTICLLASQTLAVAQQATCTISGYLYRPSGLPAANETLYISSAEQGGLPIPGFTQFSATADGSGFIKVLLPRNAEVWVRANNVTGLNNLDNVPILIPDSDASSIETLWHRTDGILSFNQRVGDVTLNSSDVNNALGYVPANTQAIVSGFNNRVGPVTLTGQDVTVALNYTPVSPSGIVAAFNASSENVALQLKPATNGTVLTVPTDNLNNDGPFKFTIANFPNTYSSKRDWVMTWGYNQSWDGGWFEQSGEPALSFRIESFYTPTPFGGQMECHLQYVNTNGKVFRPLNYEIRRDTDVITAAQEVSSLSLLQPGTQKQYMKFEPGAVTFRNNTKMLVWTPATPVLYQVNVAGNSWIPLIGLDNLDRIRMFGSGAGAVIGNGFTIGGSGNVGVKTTSPVADAAVDINGGDTSGLRLRPRSVAGAPASGTWTKGTLIMDLNCVLYVCTASGSPGTWKKVGQ